MTLTERKKTIIVVEDERTLQQNLVENLTGHGFEVFAFDDAESAGRAEVVAFADLVIMDINLPGMDGWKATELLRQQDASLPVIMLTAYTDVQHRLQGFEKGADDYIIKPFFMAELIARMHVVLRRAERAPGASRYYGMGDLHIDNKNKTVRRGKVDISLSATEFNLLVLLAEGGGSPVSKESILKSLWKGKNSVGDNTIEVYINLLRNKIDRPFTSRLIHTKAGFGYYLAEKSGIS